MTVSHKLLLAHATTTKTRPDQVVSALRDSDQAQVVQETPGGHGGISPSQVLFTYLCKLQERPINETRIQLESQEVSQDNVRGVSSDNQSTRTPQRRKPSKQFANQHPDPLHPLPQVLARHAEKAWATYRRSDASPLLGWEEGFARVANGVPNRVDRLRSLGNAIVPQIPFIIGQAINLIETTKDK